MASKVHKIEFTEDELFVLEQLAEYFLLRNPSDEEVIDLLEKKLKV